MRKQNQPPSNQYPSHKRMGKRQRQVKEVVDDLDVCPFSAIIRNAMKAEAAKQYNVAIRGWSEIAAYLQAKYKAVDPLEQAAKAKEIMGLEQLALLKEAVMTGDIHQVRDAVPEPVVIEHDTLL